MNMTDFGKKLRTLRLQKHMTQTDLAERLSVTKSVVSAYENGNRMPSYDGMILLSRIFHVTTDYLPGLEAKHEIDVSGLSEDEVLALLNLIRAMRQRG